LFASIEAKLTCAGRRDRWRAKCAAELFLLKKNAILLNSFGFTVDGGSVGTLCNAARYPKLKRQVVSMANDLLDKIPEWLKSLWHMENELRNAARNGLILRKDEASGHLAEARRHLEQAMNEAKGIEPANGPQTRLRKEGEV